MIKKVLHVQEFISKVWNLSLEYTRLIGRKFDDTGLIVIRQKRNLIKYFIYLKHSTKTDTKVCARNYDRSSNNTIEVDFLVIGGM